ncbi:hypothetical protein TPA0910_57090 [Streptomyces hygroscopicus subsp. sporocinereus]|uniref:Lipoprotein n=1 Tax=Streptomyces hygroscopicus TaxID=1912 RepID=A0ABQ3U7B7_STRHY|nr:hypothetical protein [Streptomyces hygroscopicus]GHJ31276.1 hypothetical protein TPA0910_57090 [Streptomyces hygroscopicus]
MNTATTTKRFRGRAGRRIAAAIVAAAALGLGATACGPDDSESAGSSSSSAASASQDASASAQSTGGSAKGGSSTGGTAKEGSSTGGSSSDSSGSQGQNGGGTGGGSASSGGGVANAGNHHTYVGKLQYLAPGKLIVHPDDGSTDQAFFISNATQILGAAAICGEESGHVALGEDGYGTTKCTADDLEKAAKTGSVTVRVTLSTKSAGAETVEEKYHP